MVLFFLSLDGLASVTQGGGTLPGSPVSSCVNCTVPQIESSAFGYCLAQAGVGSPNAWWQWQDAVTVAPGSLSALASSYDAQHAAMTPRTMFIRCMPAGTPTAAEMQTGTALSFISVVKWMCDDATRVSNPSSCPASSCPAALTRVAFELPVSGASPSSNEYVTICYQSCRYNIGQADLRRKADDTYVMVGDWESAGGPCLGGNPTVTPDKVQDPIDYGGGEDTPPDPGTEFSKLGTLAPGGGDTYASAIGGWFSFPSLAFLNPHAGGRTCSVDFVMPALSDHGGVAVSSWLPSGILKLDFCSWTEKIDLIGGFLLFMCTAIGIWGMWRATPGT